MQLILTPELLIEAYAQGLFPMAYSAGSPYIHWICPEKRGQLSIEKLHIPRKLKKLTLKNTERFDLYEIRTDTAFDAVVRSCAQETEDRPETWINESIYKAFCELHRLGHAHSVECWRPDGEGREELVGGLYGLALGGAFFGESMFSRARNASKIALVHLTARLWKGGFTLLDTQFVNDHLQQFGVFERTHKTYMKHLTKALDVQASFELPQDEGTIVREYLEMRRQQKRR